MQNKFFNGISAGSGAKLAMPGIAQPLAYLGSQTEKYPNLKTSSNLKAATPCSGCSSTRIYLVPNACGFDSTLGNVLCEKCPFDIKVAITQHQPLTPSGSNGGSTNLSVCSQPPILVTSKYDQLHQQCNKIITKRESQMN